MTREEQAGIGLLFLILFSVIVLHALDQLIECHSDHAQDDDRCDDHVQLKETESGNDKIEAVLRRDYRENDTPAAGLLPVMAGMGLKE